MEDGMRRFSLPCVVLCICLLAPAAFAQRFLGSVSLVPYNFEPNGSAFCDGRLLPISQFTALFSLLGTQFGGNGTTNFALPDLRGRVAIGMGQGPGLTSRVMGESGGEESVTLTVAQMPAHSHTAIGSASPGNTVSPTGTYWAPGPRMLLYSAANSLVPMNTTALGNSGGGQPHENRAPFLTLNYVIWETGIFPSRS
jgi:microcystin-dependent protein